MKKFEFLYKLQQGLAPMSPTDRMERCAFYEELIDDMLEDGYTEEAAVERLGDPAALAEVILRDEPEAAPGQRRGGRGWQSILSDLLRSGTNALSHGGFRSQSFSLSIPADSVRSVDIRWASGDLELLPGDVDTIMLTEQRSDDDPPLFAEVVDGTLRVSFTEAGRICRRHKDLSVTLPRGLSRVLDGCAAVTHNGDVTFRDLRSDTIRAETKAGDITFRDLRALRAEAVSISGDLRLDMDADHWEARSVSGDLEFTGAAADALTAETVSGDGDIRVKTGELTLKAVSGDMYYNGEARHIRVNTVSGDAELYLTALPETLSGSTMSGDLEITLPRGSQCRTSFRTKTGELTCSGEGINTSPGPLLELSTVSGDATVTA